MDVTAFAWLAPALPTLWWVWAKIRPHMKLRIKFELNLNGKKDEK